MRKEMFKGLKISKDVKEALATVEEDLILVEETGGTVIQVRVKWPKEENSQWRYSRQEACDITDMYGRTTYENLFGE